MSSAPAGAFEVALGPVGVGVGVGVGAGLGRIAGLLLRGGGLGVRLLADGLGEGLAVVVGSGRSDFWG
ncbi:hypothetical protein [Streptomyces sp. NPDC013187]|uniref:hypothetical protein n=1 Tax=Streptomyces sp. NPDC013187 TaxID=3364865 RepID=UPI0036A76CBD